MATRLAAKKYLVGLSLATSHETERQCVVFLIQEHRRVRADALGPHPLSWFGRLLWRLFGRWL